MYICIQQNNIAIIQKINDMANDKKYSRWSFQKGLDNIRSADLMECRKKLKCTLNIQSSWGLRLRATGAIIPKADEIEKIEGIFKEYGITEIWG